MATPCPTATAFLPQSSFDPPPQPACLRLDTLLPPRINRWSSPWPPSNSPRYGRTAHRSTTSSRRTDSESSKSTTESHHRPQRSSSPRQRSHPHRPNRPHHRIHVNLGISAGEWITLQEGITSIPHIIPHQACKEWKSCFLTVIREAIAKHDTERREAAFNLLLLLQAVCC